MDFYRKVTPKTSSLYTKETPNMGLIYEQSRQLRAEREAKAKETLENAQMDAARKAELRDREKAARIILEGRKKAVVAKLYSYVPLCVMNECFSSIVLKALPHDADYIEKIAPSLEFFNKIYLHHLGGFKYLKETAFATKNPFLMKWYKMVKENSEEIINKRIAQIQDVNNEDDLAKILKSGVDPDQAEKIHNDIEDLSVDDIAELVQNKVLDVVKDESERQAKDAALRQELSTRAKEYEDQKNEELNVDVASGEAEDQDDEQNPDETKNETDTNEEEVPEEKEEPQSESAYLAKYMLDPMILHETTLFYSMVHCAYKDLLNKAVKEDASSILPKTPTKVLTSPLNLNLFDVYLSDYQNDLADIDGLRISNNDPIAGDETSIDSDDVLAEEALADALMQYTVLETAMTIGLINPTSKEVRDIAEYNMKFANRK